MWPVVLIPVFEELIKLGGEVIRAALEAWAWQHRIEGMLVASAFWVCVILLGWVLRGTSKPWVKLVVVLVAFLVIGGGYFAFGHVGSLFAVSRKPLLPILRPNDPDRPSRPWRPLRGDEPTEESA